MPWPMRMPARRFRECMEVQVTIRSPIPGQAGKGLPPAPQGHPQPGDLRQAPGHEHGLGVVPVTHAGRSSPAHRAMTFFRAAPSSTPTTSLLTVDAEAVVHKTGPAPSPPPAWSAAGRDHGGGHPPGHLLGVGGAGEGHHRAVVPGAPRCMHLRHAQGRSPSQSPWTR